MSTDIPTSLPTPPAPPPRPRRLLRTPDDRVIGGVAGGLGRYFGVDAVLFRLAFVVLAFFGGITLLLYPLAWLFVPADDGTGRPAPGPGIGRVAAILALVAAALVAAGLLFFAAGWATAEGGGLVVAGVVVALGLGAVAGALTRNRWARWLWVPALVLALPAGVIAAAGVELDGGYGERSYRPASVAAVPAEGYKLGAGAMRIDLRDLPFAPGTTTEMPVKVGLGATTLIVPPSVCVTTDADVGAGMVDILGREKGGFDVRFEEPAGATRAARLALRADLGMGALEVVDDPADAQFDERSDHGGLDRGGRGWNVDDNDRRGPADGNRACRPG